MVIIGANKLFRTDGGCVDVRIGAMLSCSPSPNCYQVTPVHYGSAADVNKKDTKDEESLKTRYSSEFRDGKMRRRCRLLPTFAEMNLGVRTFKCLHNTIALNDVRQPQRA